MKKMRFHYHTEKKRRVCIFAKGETILETVVLLCRGYKPHMTLFGYVMKKEV